MDHTQQYSHIDFPDLHSLYGGKRINSILSFSIKAIQIVSIPTCIVRWHIATGVTDIGIGPVTETTIPIGWRHPTVIAGVGHIVGLVRPIGWDIGGAVVTGRSIVQTAPIVRVVEVVVPVAFIPGPIVWWPDVRIGQIVGVSVTANGQRTVVERTEVVVLVVPIVVVQIPIAIVSIGPIVIGWKLRFVPIRG